MLNLRTKRLPTEVDLVAQLYLRRQEVAAGQRPRQPPCTLGPDHGRLGGLCLRRLLGHRLHHGDGLRKKVGGESAKSDSDAVRDEGRRAKGEGRRGGGKAWAG